MQPSSLPFWDLLANETAYNTALTTPGQATSSYTPHPKSQTKRLSWCSPFQQSRSLHAHTSANAPPTSTRPSIDRLWHRLPQCGHVPTLPLTRPPPHAPQSIDFGTGYLGELSDEGSGSIKGGASPPEKDGLSAMKQPAASKPKQLIGAALSFGRKSSLD